MKRYFLVILGSLLAGMAFGDESGPILSPDGTKLGTYQMAKDNKTSLELGGKTFGPYDWVNPTLDWISPNGNKYLTRGYKKGVSYLLDTGKETRLDNLNFEKAPNQGYWYSWSRPEGQMFNINGAAVGPVTMPPVGWGGGGPFFFSDGSHWAMSTLVPNPVGQGDASQVILDGEKPVPGWNVTKIRDAEGEAFTWFVGGSTENLVSWRADGKVRASTTLYSLAKDSTGWTLSIGGTTFGPFEFLTRPVVAPDGQHWAVVAKQLDGSFTSIFDGVQGVRSPKGIGAESLTVDFVGRHLTYHVRLHSNDLVAYQITDDQVLGPFARAGVPEFSKNGLHSMSFVEVSKVGSRTLFFDGKSYGPFTGMRDGDRRYFDLENGHFVFQNREKSGVMAVTDQGTFGPYQEVYPLATGPRNGNALTGLLWGFVGKLKNGTGDLHVFQGFPGGGKTYPNVMLPSEGSQDVTPDGQDWFYPMARQRLHNGEVID